MILRSVELRETQFIYIGFGLADSTRFGERRVSKATHRNKKYRYSITSSARPSSVVSVMVDFQARPPARPSTSTNLLTGPQDNQR